ncbi:unnamed protein product [Amoebophrya sp. A25]|nr:unnamed protein product [Amoebophrya sp. A25]|eukprot:GSA25T00013550001.1
MWHLLRSCFPFFNAFRAEEEQSSSASSPDRGMVADLCDAVLDDTVGSPAPSFVTERTEEASPGQRMVLFGAGQHGEMPAIGEDASSETSTNVDSSANVNSSTSTSSTRCSSINLNNNSEGAGQGFHVPPGQHQSSGSSSYAPECVSGGCKSSSFCGAISSRRTQHENASCSVARTKIEATRPQRVSIRVNEEKEIEDEQQGGSLVTKIDFLENNTAESSSQPENANSHAPSIFSRSSSPVSRGARVQGDDATASRSVAGGASSCSTESASSSAGDTTGLAVPVVHRTQSAPGGKSSGTESDKSEAETVASVTDAGGAATTPIEKGEKTIFPGRDFRARMLNRLSHEGILPNSSQRAPQTQCVTIFDWDDTLCCTSYFTALRLKKKSCTQKDLQALRSLEKLVRDLLTKAKDMGSVYIITNAMEGWVEYSCERWLPRVKSLVCSLPILSARAWESQYDVSRWKTMAFRSISERMDARPVTNLIAIGDSVFEINAAHDMATFFPNSLVKTVQLDQRPTPANLVNQLELVAKNLRAIVISGNNMEVSFMRTAAEDKTRTQNKAAFSSSETTTTTEAEGERPKSPLSEAHSSTEQESSRSSSSTSTRSSSRDTRNEEKKYTTAGHARQDGNEFPSVYSSSKDTFNSRNAATNVLDGEAQQKLTTSGSPKETQQRTTPLAAPYPQPHSMSHHSSTNCIPPASTMHNEHAVSTFPLPVDNTVANSSYAAIGNVGRSILAQPLTCVKI